MASRTYGSHIVCTQKLTCNGEHYGKSQPIKMQSCSAQSQWIHLQHNSQPKAQGSFQRSSRKIIRARVSGSLCETLSPKKSETTPVSSHHHDFLNMGRPRMAIDMLNARGKTRGLHPTQRHLRKADSWRNSPPHTHRGTAYQPVIQYHMGSSENQKRVTLCRLSRVCLYI